MLISVYSDIPNYLTLVSYTTHSHCTQVRGWLAEQRSFDVYDGPCMQWGAGVSLLASWGEGPESWWLVMVIKSVWL